MLTSVKPKIDAGKDTGLLLNLWRWQLANNYAEPRMFRLSERLGWVANSLGDVVKRALDA